MSIESVADYCSQGFWGMGSFYLYFTGMEYFVNLEKYGWEVTDWESLIFPLIIVIEKVPYLQRTGR